VIHVSRGNAAHWGEVGATASTSASVEG
jgi:hypothetical protein